MEMEMENEFDGEMFDVPDKKTITTTKATTAKKSSTVRFSSRDRLWKFLKHSQGMVNFSFLGFDDARCQVFSPLELAEKKELMLSQRLPLISCRSILPPPEECGFDDCDNRSSSSQPERRDKVV